MTQGEVLRALHSVGFAAFVQHLDLFRGQDTDAALLLEQRSGWAASGCRTRVNRARAILRAGKLGAALRLIEASDRMPEDVRAAARAARTKA